MVKVYGKSAAEVSRAIRKGDVTIDLVGIGNMGLPVAVAFAKEGAQVVGVRTNQALVDQINRGESPLIGEPKIPELLTEMIKAGKFRATTDGTAAAKDSDVIILLLPLLVNAIGQEDYSIIQRAAEVAGKGLEKGDLVITSTTMPPGATERVVNPVLEAASGLVAGKDFGLAHSPERLMVGRVVRNLYKFPKIVGGIDRASTEAAAGVYGVFGDVVQTSTLLAAELVKVAEGTFRDVNIGYANFLAKLCEPLGVDAWEVIAAANEDTREHCMIHRPSAGVGGHCIPIYPWFLINKAKEVGINPSFLRQARHINDSMPSHTVNLIIRCLNSKKKSVKGSKISLLGISFRADVKETRFAPSLRILEQLREYNPKAILACDPFFSKKELTDFGFTAASFDEALNADCVVLLASHSVFQKAKDKLIAIEDRLIDTTNLLPHSKWKVGRIPIDHLT
ncbi:MAG: nucleotide sugar dehydrogenase [Candidatus Hermodarchaeia archaeon]|jgi:nucleotide sugar dehydrogenase